MSSVSLVVLTMACVQLASTSLPGGLRGAVGDETTAEAAGVVSATSPAADSLGAQAAFPRGPWCQFAPWLCQPHQPHQPLWPAPAHHPVPAPAAPAPAPAPAPSSSAPGSSQGGSCARFGCDGGFRPQLPCQCNSACLSHGSCCHDYQEKCRAAAGPSSPPAPAPSPSGGRSGNVMTLYHQTSPEIAALILQSSFKPGTEGWCGGGIYFATTPKATDTKAIGPESHKGFIIEAQVDVGKVLHMSKTCDRSMTGEKLRSMSYDSVTFNPGDGDEYIVYSSNRVLSMKQYGH